MFKRNQSSLGIDLSDKTANFCRLDADMGVVAAGKIELTPGRLAKLWTEHAPVDVVVIEAGTPATWVAELLEGLAARVIVANPRQLKLVTESVRKSDARDAEMLARLGLADERLLSPTYVRPAAMRQAMRLLKARDQQVRARTATVLEIRSQVKLVGQRLPSCDAEHFEQLESQVPPEIREDLEPLFEALHAVNKAIASYDERIVKCSAGFPPVAQLDAIDGVGPITALAFVAVIGDPARFATTRDVGAYLGLVPRRDQSGNADPARRITKAGNGYLRRLLVQCGQRLCQAGTGRDTALRRRARAQIERVGKTGKRRVIVAVARKLAVTMLSIWKSGQRYEPLHRVATVPAADVPQPVVPTSAPSAMRATKPAPETAPSTSTRTQSCTGGASPSKSADGSMGRSGASTEAMKPERWSVARAAGSARPAPTSPSATPGGAEDPTDPVGTSPRNTRSRTAAKERGVSA